MTRVIDLDDYMDDRPISRAHVVLLSVCALAMLLDGFDIYIVGSLGPAIAAYFKVPPASLSRVFLLQQAGLALGAFLISPVADRVGRKKVLLACTFAFGLLTLAALAARTLLEFSLLRCAAGFFLSGVIPTALALLMETAPRRMRGRFVSIAFVGYGAGPTCGALVGAFLLKDHGWQIGFWIAGLLSLLFIGAGAALLHETPQFRFARDPKDPLIARAVKRFCPDLRDQDLAFTRQARAIVHRANPRVIFGSGRAIGTVLLWSMFFFGMGTLAFEAAWLPTVFLVKSGVPLIRYSSVVAVAGVLGLLGTLSVGFFLDRFRPSLVLAVIYLGVAVAMLVLPHAVFGTLLFTVSLMALKMLFGGGQTGMNAVATQFYPVEMRATGVGWAFGAGRIGSIVGPAAGGLMLTSDLTLVQFFMVLTVPILLTAAMAASLGGATRRAGRGVGAAS